MCWSLILRTKAWHSAIEDGMVRWTRLYYPMPYKRRAVLHIQVHYSKPKRHIVMACPSFLAKSLCLWCLHHLPSHALSIFSSNSSWNPHYIRYLFQLFMCLLFVCVYTHKLSVSYNPFQKRITLNYSIKICYIKKVSFWFHYQWSYSIDINRKWKTIFKISK